MSEEVTDTVEGAKPTEPTTESGSEENPQTDAGQPETKEPDWSVFESLLEQVDADEILDRALSKKPMKIKVMGKEKEIRSLADLKLRGGNAVASNDKYEEAKAMLEQAQQTMVNRV